MMLKLDQNGNLPTHEKTGMFFAQFIPIPGALSGQLQLMLVPGSGIPMRDYFAAKVIEAIIPYQPHINYDPIEDARMAYRVADAMIEARKPAEKDHIGFPYKDGTL